MNKIERTDHTIGLVDTVVGIVGGGYTRGDVDRMVALSRVTGAVSLIAEAMRPGAEVMDAGRDKALLFNQADKVQRAVRAFDRANPDPSRDREDELTAAQQALCEVQPWAL